MTNRRLRFAASFVLSVSLAVLAAHRPAHGAETLPAQLTDAEFWKLVDGFSEPSGFFQSDNLLSNEIWFQTVIPDLTKTAKSGRVYLGVGPEQNFTYIAALKPKMAF